jgi:hypothetical protein
MTCDSVLPLIPLYFYGELAPPEEERVEEHLHACAACSREMERQRVVGAALTQSRVETPAALLEECRVDLMAAIRGGAPRQIVKAPGPWTLFLQALAHSFDGLGRMRQPVGAVALLAVGFFANNLINRRAPVATIAPSPSDQTFNTVRSVQADSPGHVQIAFDETHRRVLSGSTQDRDIQQLLLAAAREDNPAVRVESMDLLKNRSDSGEVKNALLNAVAHDPNPGVRLKAVEGLKPLAAVPDVRKVLAQVLLSDDNSAVRMQVVDLLVEHRDDAIVGVLQDLMQKEDNSYVRLKSEKALKEMNASIGTF